MVSNPIRPRQNSLIQDDLITGEFSKIIGIQLDILDVSKHSRVAFDSSSNLSRILKKGEIKSDLSLSSINYYKEANKLTNIVKIKILPQFKVENYRLDFAIIIEKYFNGDWTKPSLFNFECDGYNFHSSKEQIKKDNARVRALSLRGWQTIRLSGSEIYSKKEMNKYILNFFMKQA